MKCLSFFILAVIAGCAFAKCNKYTVNVRNSYQLHNALVEARAGAYISLAPGTYEGSFTVTAHGDPDDDDCSIRIDGHGKANFSGGDQFAFRFLNASNIILMDVGVTHFAFHGILIEGSESIYLSGVKFSHISYNAVAIVDGKYNTVQNCQFSDIRDNCIRITSKTVSSENEIDQNDFLDNLGGVLIYLNSGAQRTTVTGNTVSGKNCTYTSWMEVTGSDTYVRENVLKDDKSNPRFKCGILSVSKKSYYRKNEMTVTHPGKFAIICDGSGEVVCLSNTVSGGGVLTNIHVDNSC